MSTPFENVKFGQLGGFKGMLQGDRILSAVPRLRSNSMLMARFMPKTMDVINNVKANAIGGTTFFVPYNLMVGLPRSGLTQGFSMPTSFSGMGNIGKLSAATGPRQSVWGLYDAETNEPQMFIAIKEYSATVNGTRAYFVDAEFAKAKSTPMEVKVFEGDTAREKAVSFPDDAGHALFTWEVL